MIPQYVLKNSVYTAGFFSITQYYSGMEVHRKVLQDCVSVTPNLSTVNLKKTKKILTDMERGV